MLLSISKKHFAIVFGALLLSLTTLSQNKEKGGLEWHTDLFKVYELSNKSKKPVFAFFTGSDWCGWCKKLEAEVFAKKEFIEWAKKNVVLLEVDFPRGKQLAPELQQQNANLQQSFGVSGYPTIWMFHLTKNDSTRRFAIDAVGTLGYPAGAIPGKEEVKFLGVADSLIKISKKKK